MFVRFDNDDLFQRKARERMLMIFMSSYTVLEKFHVYAGRSGGMKIGNGVNLPRPML